MKTGLVRRANLGEDGSQHKKCFWKKISRCRSGSFFLVPRLRPGTHIFRALPGNHSAFWPIMEAEPPGHAFPGGAWEREVWHDFGSLVPIKHVHSFPQRGRQDAPP
jgi:hypothetical protein